jgi:L-galactonate 5-dehydrogenase
VDDRKLDTARRAGAAHALSSRTTALRERLLELTDGEGPDVVIEAVGHPDTFVSAVTEVAVAGRVVFIGYAKAPVTFDTTQFVRKELDVLGSRNATADDFRGVIAMLRDGRFPVADAVTRVVPLDAAGDALAAWDADPGAVTRIHVEID